MMQYVVDVQGLNNHKDEFICKELIILTVEEEATPQVYTFKSPYSWSCLRPKQKSCNRWLERNYHGIPWSSGDLSQDKVRDILWEKLRSAGKVFVKGLEKKRWLQEMLPSELRRLCYNIEDINCPSLHVLPKIPYMFCSNHPLCQKPVCAVQNANSLVTWLLTEYRYPTSEGADEVDTAALEILHSMYEGLSDTRGASSMGVKLRFI